VRRQLRRGLRHGGLRCAPAGTGYLAFWRHNGYGSDFSGLGPTGRADLAIRIRIYSKIASIVDSVLSNAPLMRRQM